MVYTVVGGQLRPIDVYPRKDVKQIAWSHTPTFTSSWVVDNGDNHNNKKTEKEEELKGPGIPGFDNFTKPESSWSKKRIWFLVYVVCMCLCIAQTSERLDYFFKYPMAMTLNLERTTVWTYPEVTICPVHPFESGQIRKMLEECREVHGAKCDQVQDLLTYEKGLDTGALWNLIGADLWDTIADCRYGWNVGCRTSEYWRTELTFVGRCYSIHIPYKLPYGGPRLGLNILLRDLYMPQAHTLGHLRWKVLLHENDTVVDYSVQTRPVIIYKNTRTVLMFWKKVYNYEDTPIRPCYSTSRVIQCLAKCYDQKLLNNSQCRLPFQKTLTNMAMCTTAEEFKRVYSVTAANVLSDVESCKCGRACEEVTYDVQPDAKKEEVTNSTRIILYPAQSDVELIRERRAYPINALFSDIGGALGLYLGACLITFLELVVFLVRATAKKMTCKRNRSTPPPPASTNFVRPQARIK